MKGFTCGRRKNLPSSSEEISREGVWKKILLGLAGVVRKTSSGEKNCKDIAFFRRAKGAGALRGGGDFRERFFAGLVG